MFLLFHVKVAIIIHEDKTNNRTIQRICTIKDGYFILDNMGATLSFKYDRGATTALVILKP